MTVWVVCEITPKGDIPVGVYGKQVKAIDKRDEYGPADAFITRLKMEDA